MMSKKVGVVLFSIALVFALSACGNPADEPANMINDGDTVDEPVDLPVEEPADEEPADLPTDGQSDLEPDAGME
jgi:hypothetical protein